MRRKFVAIFALLLLLCIGMSSVSFAAYGSTMPLDARGTSNSIVYVKRPESLSASTSDLTYTISAVGAQGTAIKLYKYNPASGVCHLIKNTTYIGASGFFSTVVTLTDDNNIFVIHAENAFGEQITRVDISKIRKSTVNKLKTLTVTMKNFLE